MVTIRCNDVVFQAVQAVLFDKDGTLASCEAFLRHLGQRRSRLIDAQVPGIQDPLLMAFGIDRDRINPNGLMAVGTRRENEIAAAAYVAETGRSWLESLEIVRSAFEEADQYSSNKAEQTPLFDGILNLLQSLSVAGTTLAILSSDTSQNVQDFVQKYQLEQYFQGWFGTDQGPGKTDLAYIQQIFEILAIDPKYTVIVGDSQADAQAARIGGFAGSIGATWGWSSPIHLDTTGTARQVSEICVLASQPTNP